MSKHTQQEWQRDGATVYALNIEGTNRFFAHVQGGWATQGRNRTESDEVEANARLIAAAPELLEALKDLIGWVPGGVHFHTDAPQRAVERASAAIAKATGEA
ncbi:TPA: hypothetical protein QDZ75_004306 [Stenotrophomonas maltophilia]|nr:hypothetical protein [Stenotrophomonas maltophilia]